MDAHIGPYRVIGALGRGGMGEVFLALRQGPRGFVRRVVIKRLFAHLCGDPEAERRFVEEAVLGGQLDHIHIAKILDLGVSQGQPYMVMEHVDGVDLKTLLVRCGALTAAQVMTVGVALAQALHYAHTLTDAEGEPLGVVHRDVSPSNILVSRRGAVKLSDFGVAKARGREATQTGIIKGKYAYMSPEQIERKRLDARSDLFSLAAVLAEALLGERVFQGRRPLEVMAKVRRGAPQGCAEALVARDPALGAVLLKALEVDRAARHADAWAFAWALADLQTHDHEVMPHVGLGRRVEVALAARLSQRAASGAEALEAAAAEVAAMLRGDDAVTQAWRRDDGDGAPHNEATTDTWTRRAPDAEPGSG